MRVPIVFGSVAFPAMVLSCMGGGPKLADYSYSDYRQIYSVSSMGDISCLDSAYAEVQKIGFDTSLLRLMLMEDDSIYLFSFGPKTDPVQSSEGNWVVHAGGAVDVFYSKTDCKKRRVVFTQ